MRKILITLFLIICVVNLNLAQTGGSITLNLEIVDTQKKPLANTLVTLTETTTKNKVSKTTDALGKVTITANGGKLWQLGILKIQNNWFWQFKVDNGVNKTLDNFITYNFKQYERETRPVVDRSTLKLEKIVMKPIDPNSIPDTITEIILEIKRANKSPLSQYDVQLTCYSINKIFLGKTDLSGVAKFYVPYNKEYQIDIDGIENFTFIDAPDKKDNYLHKVFTYEPTNIKETIKKDTVIQDINGFTQGTSGRNLVNITVLGGIDKVWKNERIYVKETKGNKVYFSRTNQNGIVSFLLPKGKIYLIHGRYENDIDAIDLSRVEGIGNTNLNIYYRPKEELQYPERFLPNPNLIKIKEFENFVNTLLPRPKPGETFITYAKFANKINENSKQAVLQLGFAAEDKDVTGEISSAPLNISLVVDNSGSMAGYNRIENLKVALLAFVKKLRPDDIVSLVKFETDGVLLVPAGKVKNIIGDLNFTINRMGPGGGTTIKSGMQIGYNEILKNYKKGITNRLILLTDGYGDDNITDLTTFSKSFNLKGIECSAIGVGEDYNYSLLKILASTGGGLVSFATESEQIPSAFLKEIGNAVSPLAKNVKIEISYNKQLLFAQLYGIEFKEKYEGKLILKLDNAYRNYNKLAFIKFTLLNPNIDIEKEPVIIKTTFFDVEKKINRESTLKVLCTWNAVNGVMEYEFDNENKKLYTIAILNQAMKEMADNIELNNYEKSAEIISNTMNEIKMYYPQISDIDIEELINKLLSYESIIKQIIQNKK